jgi:hypothetical protein
MPDLTPEELDEIRKRIAARETTQPKEAARLGISQPQLSTLLSGKKYTRKSPDLSPAKREAVVTAVRVNGLSYEAVAEEFGVTLHMVNRILRAWGEDRERENLDVEIAPILSDGEVGHIWRDAFEVRRNKKTGEVFIRCQDGYKHTSQPKMLKGNKVRLRVCGPDGSVHRNALFDVKVLEREAFRHVVSKPDHRPWQAYIYLIDGAFQKAATKGGKAAVEGLPVPLVPVVKMGATQQDDPAKRVPSDAFKPWPRTLLASLPGFDKPYHDRWADFQIRRQGCGREFFEYAGEFRVWVEAGCPETVLSSPSEGL